MGRQLRTFVHVGGEVYGPHSVVPDEVAELITNPKAWADDGPDEGASAYAGQKVADLKAEVDRRNGGREDGAKIVLPGGHKSDLIAALEADDQAV